MLATVGACSVGSVDPPDADFVDDGTIRLIDVEGDCWVIEADTATYEPLNLAEGFRVDGLFVSFWANERPDLVGVCQVGPVVEIVSMGVPED
jgi:hypothetical protein